MAPFGDGILLVRHQRTIDQVPHPLGDLFEISMFYTNCQENKKKIKEDRIRENEVKQGEMRKGE